MLLPTPDSVTSDVMTIIQALNEDVVKKGILNDPILLNVASTLFMRYGNEKKNW